MNSRFVQLEHDFIQLADDDRAAQMEAYMRDRFPFFGIQTPQRRAVYKALLKEERVTKTVDWAFLQACWADDRREFQYFVVDYLTALKKSLVFEDIPVLEDFIRTKQWWDTIDALAKVVGSIGERDARVASLMREWATDGDMWVRRVAILHQLGRKDRTDSTLLGDTVAPNLRSAEFFINKAIGWALREYSKTDPLWVQEFLVRNKRGLMPLSVHEASKYL